MSTYEIVEAWKREQRQEARQVGIQEGMQKGRHEGLQRAVLKLYEARFGVPPEDLAIVVRATYDDATLDAWIELTGTGTKDEVLARLRGHRAS